LLQFGLAPFFLGLQSVGVNLGVSDSLVLSVHNLELLLQSVDKLESLFLWQKELLLVYLLLLLLMKVLNELVFIINLFLNLR
jgi:hypothetical protein